MNTLKLIENLESQTSIIMNNVVLEWSDKCKMIEGLFSDCKESLKNLGEVSTETEPAKTCCAKLPNDNKIEQVAFDESGQQDWNKLEDERTYRSGFVDGAKWFRSQIR